MERETPAVTLTEYGRTRFGWTRSQAYAAAINGGVPGLVRIGKRLYVNCRIADAHFGFVVDEPKAA